MSHRRYFYKNSVHHIFNRAVDKKPIFIQPDDKKFFINLMMRKVKEYSMHIYAYCVMDNHFHFIIKNNDSISDFFRDIESMYAKYYNRLISRKGHVFNDRFKSPAIETYRYLKKGILYVLNNPGDANIVDNPFHYQWSSINEYFSGTDSLNITKTEVTEKLFKSKHNLANMLRYYSHRPWDSKFVYSEFVGNDEFRKQMIKSSDKRENIRSKKIICRRHDDRELKSTIVEEALSQFEKEYSICLESLHYSKNGEKHLRYRLIKYLREELKLKYIEIKKINAFHDLAFSSLPKLYQRACQLNDKNIL